VELTMSRLLIYGLLIAAALALYYGLEYLPAAWRDWLAGKKTKLVAWGAIVVPEMIDILTQVQALGLIDYAPGPYQKVITQILGVLVLVCRLRTAREQGAAP
jgi:hypothetical protein